MIFDLYVSSFCGACARTRAVLTRATDLIPGARLVEHNIASDPDRADSTGITSTPTVIIRSDDGKEVGRAAGVPTLDQVLGAAARAV
ncbi:glutaredoxin family protein [Corynebacterium pacaense]|uniref:glutaredoxin family protein n=1 Tax=Corynebacterium pacaense TaxID=1816684 RepID=UPI0009BB3869|nr:thiol reductase thioredoxin [Corynebacterium pacaense]